MRQEGIEAMKEQQVSTEEAVRNAVRAVLWNASNYPAKVTPHMLGQDITPLVDKVVSAALGAIHPAPQDWEYGVHHVDAGGWGETRSRESREAAEKDFATCGMNCALVRRRPTGSWEPVPQDGGE